MAEKMDKKILSKLSQEMVYQRFLIGRREVRRFMDGLGTVEFIILSMAIGQDRIYMKDISKELEMPMNELSPVVERLKDKGLVVWTHDGYGEAGTYIMVTDIGRDVIEAHKNKMLDYYEKIFDQVDEEEFRTFIAVFKKINEVIK